jgi:uncharacterized repeat protein (TIGR03803 family)
MENAGGFRRLMRVLGFVPLILAALVPGAAAADPSLVTIYRFCVKINCADGMFPVAGLLLDAEGNVFGTTLDGGGTFNGTVFELIPNTAKTKYHEIVVHSFCSKTNPCPGVPKKLSDGAHPQAGLIRSVFGNLIGTTLNAGMFQEGAIFELKPLKDEIFGEEFVEYSFCSFGGSLCTDGIQPMGGVIGDARGDLFTTTQGDGQSSGGTVFEHRIDGANLILHSFCSLPNCADGKQPFAGLVADNAGNLYGTTNHGGTNLDAGTVFEVKPGQLKEKVIHSFCSVPPPCSDGALPFAGLIIDASGSLYGTTESGGSHNAGTVFALIPKNAKTAYREVVLYSFCPTGTCSDGALPLAGVIRDEFGNLYGTTSLGGNLAVNGGVGFGTVFELVRGADNSFTEKVLYSFCSQPRCSDGALPEAGLARDADGFLYGTTKLGGISGLGGELNGGGTVFKLHP